MEAELLYPYIVRWTDSEGNRQSEKYTRREDAETKVRLLIEYGVKDASIE